MHRGENGNGDVLSTWPAGSARRGYPRDPRRRNQQGFPGTDDVVRTDAYDRQPDNRKHPAHQEDVDSSEARALAVENLRRVGIPRAEQIVDAFPHQLSGGMRQRAMIAMALSCSPRLLIADEPTTALDVTIQAQILELMMALQEEFGMAVIFITHNLGVIAEVADEVAVMYLGRIVEQAGVNELFDNPQHPYTQGLLNSIPHIDEEKLSRLRAIEGVVPDPYEIPSGCAFSDRCPSFMPGTCDSAMPDLAATGPAHRVRCFLYSDAEEEETEVANGR